MTRRRWIADEWTATTAALLGAQAHHLARVLRATPGTEFDVVAGDTAWRAAVTAVSETRVDFSLSTPLQEDKDLPVTVLLAIFKFDRMEWALEKLTELGVSSVLPAITERTEKHLAQAAPKRVERWRRIALEAAKQSRRSGIPQIGNPLPLREAIAAIEITPRLVLAETQEGPTLASALQTAPDSLALAVGPEGGWTPNELALFAGARWTSVSLGPRILRAETAAIAALSFVTLVRS